MPLENQKDITMRKLFEKSKLKFQYSIESVRNRYPCKIVSFHHITDESKPCKVTYRYVTRLNLRTSTFKDLLDDKLLIEKFHPTECIKLGFISAGEILFKYSSKNDVQKQFYGIIEKMINDQEIL